MATPIVGARIRERRRAMEITQAELARRIGISASYLNLIERNKRAIAGPLLKKTAAALGLGLEDLDGAAERRLLEELTEIAHAPSLQQLDVEADALGAFVGRYPGWARALVGLARAERAAIETARELGDRLTHDPFLGETVHRMLTRVASIRSASEILTSYGDIPPDQRARFDAIIHEESRALSDIGEALAAYFERAEQPELRLTPVDEVEALFAARGNRFAEVEDAAAAWRDAVPPGPIRDRRTAAMALAEAELGPLVDAVVRDARDLVTRPAQLRARAAILAYAGDAILAPMDAFAPRAAALGYDIEALDEQFALGIGTVCQRLAALPEGERVPRFGYLRANAAGTLTAMRALEGLQVPRYAAACPLWVLYRAQQMPATVIRQRALFPSGARFVFVARARRAGPSGFGQPRHFVTDMLAMSEADARHTVYGPDASVQVEEVGPACRICARSECAHRVADPLSG